MFKYVKAVFRGAYKLLFAYPKICKYARNKDKYSLEERYSYARKLVKIIFKALNIKVETFNLEKLNNEDNLVFVCNHQGFMDALTMIYVFEKPIIFVTKKEARDYPIAGKIIYFLDAIFMDRENIRDAVRMVKECKQYLLKGVNVAIFPEGTRSRDENHCIGEYKPGALKPAYDTNKNIAYFVIDGGYTALSTKYKKQTIIKFKCIDVINSSDYKEQNTSIMAKEIENNTKKELKVLREVN